MSITHVYTHAYTHEHKPANPGPRPHTRSGAHAYTRTHMSVRRANPEHDAPSHPRARLHTSPRQNASEILVWSTHTATMNRQETYFVETLYSGRQLNSGVPPAGARFERTPVHKYMGHNYAGYNYIGHNYTGHNYTGHNYTGHTYTGHNYTGHNYIGHNYAGHNYIVI